MIIKLYFSFEMLAQISQPGTWLIHEVPADRFQDLMSIADSCALQLWKIFKNIFEYYHYNSWYIHLHIKGKKGASSLVSFMWCLKLNQITVSRSHNFFVIAVTNQWPGIHYIKNIHFYWYKTTKNKQNKKNMWSLFQLGTGFVYYLWHIIQFIILKVNVQCMTYIVVIRLKLFNKRVLRVWKQIVQTI